MAHVSDIRPTNAALTGTSIFSRIGIWRTALTTAVKQYGMYRATLGELRNLSTRELDDLGLNAETIRATAYKAAYK